MLTVTIQEFEKMLQKLRLLIREVIKETEFEYCDDLSALKDFDKMKLGIKNGYLSDIRCMTVDIGCDLSDVHKQHNDLNIRKLSNAVDTPVQNLAVAEAYKNYAVGQTLIFAATVKHAENIAELIDGAVVVSAETPDRNEIIQKFTNRKIPCIVNCMVFTEGTDMPLIETVIIAHPDKKCKSLYTNGWQRFKAV